MEGGSWRALVERTFWAQTIVAPLFLLSAHRVEVARNGQSLSGALQEAGCADLPSGLAELISDRNIVAVHQALRRMAARSRQLLSATAGSAPQPIVSFAGGQLPTGRWAVEPARRACNKGHELADCRRRAWGGKLFRSDVSLGGGTVVEEHRDQRIELHEEVEIPVARDDRQSSIATDDYVSLRKPRMGRS